MADHVFEQPLTAKGPRQVLVTCSFVTAGVSAPTGFTGKGVVSVTRTGVGTFDVLLAQGWTALFPVSLTVGGAAAAQVGRPSIRTVTASTRKVTIATVESDAAPIDIETTGVTIYAAFLLQVNG